MGLDSETTPNVAKYYRMKSATQALSPEQAKLCLAYLVECLFPFPNKEHSAEGIRGIILDACATLLDELPPTPDPEQQPSTRQDIRTDPTPVYSFPTDELSAALPNLDATQDAPELEHYAREFHRIAWVFTRLQCYAANKALAVQHRLAGDIRSAQDAEDHADLEYNDLPEWAKW